MLHRLALRLLPSLTLAVTEEPRGGSREPTGIPVVTGKLSAA